MDFLPQEAVKSEKTPVLGGGGKVRNTGATKPWVPEVQRARELVNQGESKRKVAKFLGMPESTLRKRLKNLSRTLFPMQQGGQLAGGSQQPAQQTPNFSPELEEELVKYCTAFNDMSGGLTFTALRKIIYNFAEENHIENSFDRNVRMADVEFINDFLQRHPGLSRAIRPSGIDLGHDKDQLGRFFDQLKEQLLTHQFNASRIYNVALLDVSVTRPDKTIDTISAICCVSAAAHYVPPAFVFHAHVFSLELLNGAPPCSIAIPHNLDIFLEWLRHFQKHVRSSHQDPVLLITNDRTFASSKCVHEFCRFHGIVPIDLPAQRLHPLHKSVFGAFRVLYELECEAWSRLHRGQHMTHRHVAAVFRKAYFRAASMDNAVEGFRMTGICPYDRDVLNDQPDPTPPAQIATATPLCHTIFQNVVCEYDDLNDVKPQQQQQQNQSVAAAYAAAVDQVANGVCDLAAGFPDIQQQHPGQQTQQHSQQQQQVAQLQSHGPRIESH